MLRRKLPEVRFIEFIFSCWFGTLGSLCHLVFLQFLDYGVSYFDWVKVDMYQHGSSILRLGPVEDTICLCMLTGLKYNIRSSHDLHWS